MIFAMVTCLYIYTTTEKSLHMKTCEIAKYKNTFFDNIILGHFKIVYIYRLRQDIR